MLKSELALARFVPVEWRGLLGFPPLELECKYVRWVGAGQKKIEAKCPVLDVLCRYWDSLDVYMFGSNRVLLPSMTLVTERLCVQYPNILERHNRGKLLKRYT